MGALKEHFHDQITKGLNMKNDDDDYQLEQILILSQDSLDEIRNLDEEADLAKFEESFRLTGSYPI